MVMLPLAVSDFIDGVNVYSGIRDHHLDGAKPHFVRRHV